MTRSARIGASLEKNPPLPPTIGGSVVSGSSRMSVLPFLIIETGHPVPEMKRYGRFQHWIRVAAGLAEQETVAIDVANGEALPDPADFAGIIVSGSAAFVTDRADWSERSAEWLRHAAHQGMPLLGICYGHQLLAHALGGEVDYNPAGANPAPSRWNCIRQPSKTLYLQAFRRSSRHMPPICRRSSAPPMAPSCWRTRGRTAAMRSAGAAPPGECSSIRSSPPTTCAVMCRRAPSALPGMATAPARSPARSPPLRSPASCCAASCITHAACKQ